MQALQQFMVSFINHEHFSLFDVLAFIGGLCLFLFGMQLMGDGLERRAGNGLKSLLGKFTNNRFKGFLTGLGITSIIQSSSATTVMVVGFVNAGLMTLRQSVGVIMGANIGTTVTAWMLSLGSLSGINVEGASIFLNLLKPSAFTPILALVGMILFMFFKSDKKKDTATILLGFATLMFGMDAMSSAVSGLAEVDAFTNMFTLFGENPLLGMLVGAALTAIIQSSSASVGILQALALSTGAISYAAAIPILMGQHIGTCVTALLSSLGTNKNAKRAAVVHLSFNVIGTTVWLTAFSLALLIFKDVPFFANVIRNSDNMHAANSFGIAVAHTALSILFAALLFPMAGLLEKIACWIVPDGKQTEEEKKLALDERFLATPAIALQQCSNLCIEMAKEVKEGLLLSISLLSKYDSKTAENVKKIEKQADKYEDTIGTYLTKFSKYQISEEDGLTVSKLLKVIGDLERISDHSRNIMESVEELKSKNLQFSDEARKELEVLTSAVAEIMENAEKALAENSNDIAYNVEPLEEVIDNLKEALRDSHIVRLQGGNCTVEAGFIWADLLTNLERVADHCSNIAGCVIDANGHNMDLHSSLKSFKRESPIYKEKLTQYGNKYQLDKVQ